MSGRKNKATRRAAKALIAQAGGGDERRTYQRMKKMLKEPDVRKKMYG